MSKIHDPILTPLVKEVAKSVKRPTSRGERLIRETRDIDDVEKLRIIANYLGLYDHHTAAQMLRAIADRLEVKP